MTKPIYDFVTKNESFLDVHYKLKDAGIKNNAFHLALFNPELQGVDPYAEDLTDEQKQAIIKECSENIFYYLREVLRVKPAGVERHMVHMDIGFLSALYCFTQNTTVYLMKPSFCHNATDALSMLSHSFKFGNGCEDFTFIGDTRSIPRRRIRSMEDMVTNGLPSYMVSKNIVGDNFDKDKVKPNNIDSYVDPVTNNAVVTSPSPRSKQEAENIGRGLSANYVYIDEFEHMKYPDVLIQSSLAVRTTLGVNAKKYGLNSGMVITSDLGKLSDENCRRSLKISTHLVRWRLEMLDMPVNEFLAYVKKHSDYNGVCVCFNYKELGLDEKWFKHSCQLLGGIPDRIDRQLLLRRI